MRERWRKRWEGKNARAEFLVARGGCGGRGAVPAGYERATSARGDRAYRIRVDRLCVSTKRFNTRRVTDSSRRSLPLQPHGRVASTCAARLRLIYGRGATLFRKIPTSVANTTRPPPTIHPRGSAPLTSVPRPVTGSVPSQPPRQWNLYNCFAGVATKSCSEAR